MLCKHFSKLFQESNCYRVPLKKRCKLKSRSFTTLGLRHGFFYENLQQKTVNSYFCTVIPLIKLLFFIETKFSATFFPIKFFLHGHGGFTWQQGEESGRFLFSSKDSDSFFRSSRPDVFHKKGVLRNFAKSTRKHLCQSFFFNKVAGLRPATLLKKTLWHRCFSVNFAKFLRTAFLTEQ